MRSEEPPASAPVIRVRRFPWYVVWRVELPDGHVLRGFARTEAQARRAAATALRCARYDR